MLKIPFPVALGVDNCVSDSYGVDSIPMTFVIDKTGKVTHSYVGFEPGLDMMLAEQVGVKDYAPNYNFRGKAGAQKCDFDDGQRIRKPLLHGQPQTPSPQRCAAARSWPSLWMVMVMHPILAVVVVMIWSALANSLSG